MGLELVIVSVSSGIGINLLTDGDVSPVGQYLGLVLVVASLVVIGAYLGRHTTDTLPRPAPRARLRRVLTEAEEALGSDATPTSSDVMRLRARIARIRGVGSRLERRAGSMRWRDVVRQERRWFLAVVVVATLLPVATVLWALARSVQGDHRIDASSTGRGHRAG